MILIADGGSTKADWIALDAQKNELFRTRTLGLNPTIVSQGELTNRIVHMFELMEIKDEVSQIFFYGAGCGSPQSDEILKKVLQSVFASAKICIAEDLLAAIYATTGKRPGIVCILGTGSNSCYFDGQKIHNPTPSLGYSIMDEASGNYFGKRLLRDFFYKKMPKKMTAHFKRQFNLDVDLIKFNLYRQPNPNKYLATFAKFMFDYKGEKYIKRMIKKGFQEFFRYWILPHEKTNETPIYFVGSIAFYFRDILEKVAKKHQLTITAVVQRPIDNLLDYHKTAAKNSK